MRSTLQPRQRHSEKFEVSRERTCDLMGQRVRLYARPMRVHDIDSTARRLVAKAGRS
jgi:hypothetical protein